MRYRSPSIRVATRPCAKGCHWPMQLFVRLHRKPCSREPLSTVYRKEISLNSRLLHVEKDAQGIHRTRTCRYKPYGLAPLKPLWEAINKRIYKRRRELPTGKDMSNLRTGDVDVVWTILIKTQLSRNPVLRFARCMVETMSSVICFSRFPLLLHSFIST